MWICPECGRKFSRIKQSHSCIQYHIEDLFFGKTDQVRRLYEVLTARMMEFGEIDFHIGKWSLTIRRLSTFLSVMVEKNHLTLVFISSQPIDEFPVYQNYQHSATRFSNAVKIEYEEEIDDQLIRWLREAWELAV
jgi:hypothetical protein